MADDLDAMLQGNDNPNASSAQNSQQDASMQGQPIEQQTEEEVEFNKLSGPAQERFKEVWRRARENEVELERLRNQQPAYVPPAPGSELAPDQKTAIDTLAKFGIATDDKVDRKVSEATNKVLWELEQTRLENKYTGQNGEPQYVREDMEDYIRKHPQYQYTPAEDVFKLRYIDEFSNLKSTKETPRRSSTLRPTKAQVMTSAINPDNVEEMVKTHSQQWYEEHIDEINEAVNAHTNQFDRSGNRV